MKKWHNLDATSPEQTSTHGKVSFPTQQVTDAYPIGINQEAVELQKQFNDIEAARRDIIALSPKEEINMEEIRNLLFSIRDQCIYCPVCRCPEFAANEMRSSHFEPCSIGAMCEKLLKLYPREGYIIKWRK